MRTTILRDLCHYFKYEKKLEFFWLRTMDTSVHGTKIDPK